MSKKQAYLFKNRSTGEVVEIKMTFTQYQKRVVSGFLTHDGQEYRRAVAEEYQRDQRAKAEKIKSCGGNAWPMESVGLGVHPDQIPEAKAQLDRHGIKAEFNPVNGNLILNTPGQRTQALRAAGMIDKDGGYRETYSKPRDY